MSEIYNIGFEEWERQRIAKLAAIASAMQAMSKWINHTQLLQELHEEFMRVSKLQYADAIKILA